MNHLVARAAAAAPTVLPLALPHRVLLQRHEEIRGVASRRHRRDHHGIGDAAERQSQRHHPREARVNWQAENGLAKRRHRHTVVLGGRAALLLRGLALPSLFLLAIVGRRRPDALQCAEGQQLLNGVVYRSARRRGEGLEQRGLDHGDAEGLDLQYDLLQRKAVHLGCIVFGHVFIEELARIEAVHGTGSRAPRAPCALLRRGLGHPRLPKGHLVAAAAATSAPCRRVAVVVALAAWVTADLFVKAEVEDGAQIGHRLCPAEAQIKAGRPCHPGHALYQTPTQIQTSAQTSCVSWMTGCPPVIRDGPGPGGRLRGRSDRVFQPGIGPCAGHGASDW